MLIGSKISNLTYTSTIEKKRVFNLYEVPKFMVAHPMGYQFACSFEGILKFYNRVEGDMQEIWHENLNCHAAKYSSSGSLILSCSEDSYTTLILYDCYNFKKLRVIPIAYLKLAATRIDWIHDNSAILLTSGTEAITLDITTGEKISEFRERQQISSLPISKVKCICFDVYNDRLVAGLANSTIMLASKR